MKIIIRQISLPPDIPGEYAVEKAVAAARKNGVKALSGSICRVSVDSRRKKDVRLVYSVLLECDGEVSDLTLAKAGAERYIPPKLEFEYGKAERRGKIAVIGFGPAGMFASLFLTENCYSVVVFERGKSVEDRGKDVERFLETKELDTESNIQFGAGGAGTFSDGKLITRINDTACSVVLQRLVGFGAPEDILTSARPHIGTDVLRTVVGNITDYLGSRGADIRFGCRVTDISDRGNGAVVRTDNSEEYFDAVVLCTGHSARDTYSMLRRRGVSLEKKPFSVGCRIEHLCEDTDRAMYGSAYDTFAGFLPHAEYNLSYRHNGRGVYSFCMCPGGKVICAATENDGVVTNGMSCRARDGANSNSALAVSVLPDDLPGDIFSGIEFQRRIERAAFAAAGGGFSAPCCTLGSFLKGTKSVFTRVLPTYEPAVKTCDLRTVFPSFITESLGAAVCEFDKKISGFAADHAVLTAPETRTSAPLRIIRDGSGASPDVRSLYPCGEGAGYAGGITSAAADGIHTAVRIMERFRPDKTT